MSNTTFNILVFLLICTSSVFAQKAEYGEEPYPAPAMYNNVSELESAFIALFDDRNVGNLHLYVPNKRTPSEDYPYKGTIITRDYKSLLPSALQIFTEVKGGEPQALGSIRGAQGELYLMRTMDYKGNHTIALYKLQNNGLEKLMELASHQCINDKCTQTDTWIQDIDGDTRFDFIQKTRKSNRPNKVKTKIYSMQIDGTIKKNKDAEIDVIDYKMEDF